MKNSSETYVNRQGWSEEKMPGLEDKDDVALHLLRNTKKEPAKTN